MLETTRTYRAKLLNHSQVSDDLDDCGFSASKLWNVARYHTQPVWDETGAAPSDVDLKRELKDHERYRDLHSQSSQRVLEELVEAFSGWYKKLHGWEFDRFTRLLEYKAEEHGILVSRVSDRDSSKTCSCCGRTCDENRVERGLYVCDSYGVVMNADVNGAVNNRRTMT